MLNVRSFITPCLLLAVTAAPATGVASCAHNIVGEWQIDPTRPGVGVSPETLAKVLERSGGVLSAKLAFTEHLVSFTDGVHAAGKSTQASAYTVFKEAGPDCELLIEYRHNGQSGERPMHVRFDATGFCTLSEDDGEVEDCFITR